MSSVWSEGHLQAYTSTGAIDTVTIRERGLCPTSARKGLQAMVAPAIDMATEPRVARYRERKCHLAKYNVERVALIPTHDCRRAL